MSSHNQVKPHQQGAALLVFIAALVMTLALLSYALLGDLGQKLKRQQAQDVGMVLAEAKENLLVFSSSQPEIYPTECSGSCGVGYFPTPDFDNDGRPGVNSELPNIWFNTNVNNVIGRIPAKHNNTSPFYFLLRECTEPGELCKDEGSSSIWVAFSSRIGDGDLRIQRRSSFRPLNSNTVKMMLDRNSDSVLNVDDCGNGIVCLDGKPIVAVLIAAGKPLGTQTDRSSSPNDFRQYLDSSNADNDLYNFVSVFPSNQFCPTGKLTDCFNDKVNVITFDDWAIAMESRVKSGFADLSTTLCSASWRAANATHWTVVNQWHTVTNICP